MSNGFLEGISGAVQLMNIYHGIRDRDDKRKQYEEEMAMKRDDAQWKRDVDARDYSEKMRQYDTTLKFNQQKHADDVALTRNSQALTKRGQDISAAASQRSHHLGMLNYGLSAERFAAERADKAKEEQQKRIDWAIANGTFDPDALDGAPGAVKGSGAEGGVLAGIFGIKPPQGVSQDGSFYTIETGKGTQGVGYAYRDEKGKPIATMVGEPVPKNEVAKALENVEGGTKTATYKNAVGADKGGEQKPETGYSLAGDAVKLAQNAERVAKEAGKTTYQREVEYIQRAAPRASIETLGALKIQKQALDYFAEQGVTNLAAKDAVKAYEKVVAHQQAVEKGQASANTKIAEQEVLDKDRTSGRAARVDEVRTALTDARALHAKGGKKGAFNPEGTLEVHNWLRDQGSIPTAEDVHNGAYTARLVSIAETMDKLGSLDPSAAIYYQSRVRGNAGLDEDDRAIITDDFKKARASLKEYNAKAAEGGYKPINVDRYMAAATTYLVDNGKDSSELQSVLTQLIEGNK